MSPIAKLREIQRLARRILELTGEQLAPQILVGLTPEQQAIMAVMTDQPQTTQRLANRSGRKINHYFRRQLAALVNMGLVRRISHGYLLP
jgi:hypothetical protein